MFPSPRGKKQKRPSPGGKVSQLKARKRLTRSLLWLSFALLLSPRRPPFNVLKVEPAVPPPTTTLALFGVGLSVHHSSLSLLSLSLSVMRAARPRVYRTNANLSRGSGAERGFGDRVTTRRWIPRERERERERGLFHRLALDFTFVCLRERRKERERRRNPRVRAYSRLLLLSAFQVSLTAFVLYGFVVYVRGFQDLILD